MNSSELVEMAGMLRNKRSILIHMLYSHEQRYIHIYIQKHKDAITTSGHSSLEKIYLSLYWKGCVRVGHWTKTATYWPHQHLRPWRCVFLVLLSCSTGVLGAQPLCWELVLTGRSGTLTSSSELQLPDFLSHLGYIIVLRPLNSTRRQSRLSPDHFDRVHLLFTQVHFSFDSLARSEVNMKNIDRLILTACHYFWAVSCLDFR